MDGPHAQEENTNEPPGKHLCITVTGYAFSPSTLQLFNILHKHVMIDVTVYPCPQIPCGRPHDGTSFSKVLDSAERCVGSLPKFSNAICHFFSVAEKPALP